MKAPPENKKPSAATEGVLTNMKTYNAKIRVIHSRVKDVRHVSEILAEIFGRAADV